MSETQTADDRATAPERPSVAVPVGLIIMGLITGMLLMCSGYVSALTPEPETIDLSATGTPVGDGATSVVEVGLDVPRGMKLELGSAAGDVASCSVRAPGGTSMRIAATKDQYGNSRADVTAAAAGRYTVACPDEARATVTNPAAADQYAAERKDLRDGKVGGLALGGGLVAVGVATGVIGRRRHDRAMARYEARQTPSGPA